MKEREREEDDIFYDLDDVDFDAIMDETDGSQEEFLGVTGESSAEEMIRALAALDKPGTPGGEQRDGHSRQELPVATNIRRISLSSSSPWKYGGNSIRL